MKREIPLEKIYERLIIENNIPKKPKVGDTIELELIISPETEKLVKSIKPVHPSDFTVASKPDAIKYTDENEINQLTGYLQEIEDEYYSIIENIDSIYFYGLSRQTADHFIVRYYNVISKQYSKKEFEKKKYLKTIPQNIRDEFGDELLSM